MSSTDQSRLLGHPPPEDTFNDAVDQLSAGLPLADILKSAPVGSRDEFSEMLTIVEFTQQVQTSAVPMPSRAKRTRSKASFLAAAQAMNAQSEVAAPIPQSSRVSERPKVVAQQATPILEPTASKSSTIHSEVASPNPLPSRPHPIRPRVPRPVQPEPSIFQQFSEAIANLFTVRTLRFAPLILLLGLFLVGRSSISTVQASIPGDFTYPIKQWVRNTQIAIAPDSERDEMLKRHEIIVADDVRLAVAKADESDIEIEAEEILLYYGMEGRRYAIGDLLVSPHYQSDDAQDDVFSPMDIMDELSKFPVGTEVRLEYQVVPGQVADDGKPIVQGVTLEVIATPEAIAVVAPNPLPTITDAPGPDGEQIAVGEIPDRAFTVPPTFTLAITPDGSSEPLPAIIFTPQNPTPVEAQTPTVTIIVSTPEPSPVLEQVGFIPCVISTLTGWESYIVRRGDTLWDLATRGGTTVAILKEVNCLKSDQIIAGDELNIPSLQSATPVVIETDTSQVIPPTVVPSTVIPLALTNTPQTIATSIPTTIPPTAIPPTIVYPTALPPTQAPQPILDSPTELVAEITTGIVDVTPEPTLLVDTSSTGETNNESSLSYEATAVPLITATDISAPSDVIAIPATVTATVATVVTGTTVTVIPTIPTLVGTPTQLPIPTVIAPATLAEIITITNLPATIVPVITASITPTLPVEIVTALPTTIVISTTTPPPDDVSPGDILTVPTATADVISVDTFTPTPISVETITTVYTTEVESVEATPVQVTPIVTQEVNAGINETESYTTEVESVETYPVEVIPTVTQEVNAGTNENDSSGLESTVTVDVATIEVPTAPNVIALTATPIPIESLQSAPAASTETAVSESTSEPPTTELPTPTLVVITLPTENSGENSTEGSYAEPTETPTIEVPETPIPTLTVAVTSPSGNNTDESYIEPIDVTLTAPSEVVPTLEPPTLEPPTPELPTPTPIVIVETNEDSTEEGYVAPTDIPTATSEVVSTLEPPTPELPTPTPVAIVETNEDSTEEGYVAPTDIPTATSEVVSTLEPPTPELPTPTPVAIIETNEDSTEESYVAPTDIPTATPTEVIVIEYTPEPPPTSTPIPVEPTPTLVVIHMFSTSTAEPTAVPDTSGSERVSPLAPPSTD